MTLTLDASAAFKVVQTSPLDLVNPALDKLIRRALAFTDGGGANQVDKLFTDQRTTADESLDLAAALVDAFGVTLTFTAIKALYIAPAAANTENLLLGGAAANGFINWVSDATDIVVVKPGGIFMLVDPTAGGYAVTAGTGDLLRVQSSGGGSITYDIAIAGD